MLALVVGAAAVVAPVACAAGAAVVVGMIVPRPPGVAMIAWWALVAVSAAVVARWCRPLAARARTLATLLDLRVEFPNRATSRLRIAASSSSALALQRRLVSKRRGTQSDELTARRMATAAALGAFKQQHAALPNPVHTPYAVLAGLALVLVGLTVSTGISSPPPRETAAPATRPPPISATVPEPGGASSTPLVDGGTSATSSAVAGAPTP
ncbi:MAG TPA: hypothetical protein VFZ17_14510, partial [Acidimicrobiia bacterium]|nr:hypothetical protein [Acidimicrobiia bacterium]